VGTFGGLGAVPCPRRETRLTLVIAHRGASIARPENTIEAFQEARRLGADMVELDVRRTADDVLVVHHDPEIPGSGALATLRYDRLITGIPTLEAALDACLPTAINIEIKNARNEPDWDAARTVATATAALVVRRELHDRVLVSSFDMGSIDRVRAIDHAIPTALLTERVDGAVDACVRHGHAAIHPRADIATRRFVADAHAVGLAVNVWTVDDPDAMRELVARGVDGICTNDPELAIRVVGRSR
jgi:glycerophosphoryl diester phosphodiesterase